ncbi:glycosyltransferase [Halobacterium sp. KA-6]|uniref:glycosyltransferase n=1 Tax=Halobacterium sp. KA-6 TaxID=2896368 RepID=UPI001E30418B|nr:glycosyltransferase [Halobacterium sp. KA-6]MCD2205023.1 glycosyltransferase [Halobacterium sp. KA-6]
MKRDIKVAMVTPWNRKGGIANYSARLVEELRANGTTVEPVPILNPETTNPFAFADIIERIPDDADVVHVQFEAGLFGQLGMSGIGAPWFLCQLRSDPRQVVTTLHEVHAAHSHRGVVGDYLLRGRDTVIESCALRASEEIVVHTRNAERILRNRHGPEIDVKRHLLPAERGKNPTPAEEAKERLGLSGPVLLTLGWIEPKKRFEDVIRALPDIPDVTYFVVGDPHPGDEDAFENALKLAERLGVRDRVVRHEYVTDEDFDDVYGAANAVVLPYRRVSVSIAVNEALSYGVPIVTSSLPYFEELRDRYGCILTYETQSELRSALEDSLFDAQRQSELHRRADKYVREVNWNSFALWTQDLYLNV